MGTPISLSEDQQVEFLLGRTKVRPCDLTPLVSARVLSGIIENLKPILKYLSQQPFICISTSSSFCDFEGWGARIQVHKARVTPEVVQLPEPMRVDEHCLMLSRYETKGRSRDICFGLYATRKGRLFLSEFWIDPNSPNLQSARILWVDTMEDLEGVFKNRGWKPSLPEILETIDQRFEWELIDRRNHVDDLENRRDRMNHTRRRMGLIA